MGPANSITEVIFCEPVEKCEKAVSQDEQKEIMPNQFEDAPLPLEHEVPKSPESFGSIIVSKKTLPNKIRKIGPKTLFTGFCRCCSVLFSECKACFSDPLQIR